MVRWVVRMSEFVVQLKNLLHEEIAGRAYVVSVRRGRPCSEWA